MSSYRVQKSIGTNLYKQTGLSKGLKLILCHEFQKSVKVFISSPTGNLVKIDAVQRHSRKLTAMTRGAFSPGGAHIIYSLCMEPSPIKTQTEYGMTCKVLDAGVVLKYHSSASVLHALQQLSELLCTSIKLPLSDPRFGMICIDLGLQELCQSIIHLFNPPILSHTRTVLTCLVLQCGALCTFLRLLYGWRKSLLLN